ncbi:hypothetical protein GCM10027562_17430 [Arthrobacter pigmenti]
MLWLVTRVLRTVGLAAGILVFHRRLLAGYRLARPRLAVAWCVLAILRLTVLRAVLLAILRLVILRAVLLTMLRALWLPLISVVVRFSVRVLRLVWILRRGTHDLRPIVRDCI